MVMVLWIMKPWHWQHVAVVKVDVNHHPVHVLQLAHLVALSLLSSSSINGGEKCKTTNKEIICNEQSEVVGLQDLYWVEDVVTITRVIEYDEFLCVRIV